MKVTRLIIKNIGKIADETIELNKPLILFYGEIRQGKTTILNSVRWVCGGSFPSDIIRHGQAGASIQLEFQGGVISRSFYKSKSGETKGRDIIFVRNGKPVPSPVAEIRRFLNPFLLDQDYLRNMGEVDRKKFFTELFAVDTSDLDTEAFECEQKARELRAKIKGYGEIDLTPIKAIDAAPLREELRKIRSDHETARGRVQMENQSIRESNREIEERDAERISLEEEIGEAEAKLKSLRADHEAVKKWLVGKKPSPFRNEPTMPDTSEVEAKIGEASAQQVRVEQYSRNVARDKDRKADNAALLETEKRQREIKAERAAKLKGITDSCAIKELAFDEAGNFTYQGTEAGMLSTSQIMRLSSELSALYPEGFGLDLIDRGESLGKSIFGFIDRAKAEKKTILATIVGEKPTKIPEEIGVFVVDDGKLIEAK
jgi:DNA repair ATPase RecN